MKIRYKFFFSVLAFMVLSASLNKGMAQVADSGTTGACTWEITGTSPNYTLTIRGTGAMANYNGSSDNPWYPYRSTVTNVVIEDGVTAIGRIAFTNMTKFTSVTIPNSVTSIGELAFNSCSGLTSITIPSLVTAIGIEAFVYCTGLTSISVDESNTVYSSNDGVLFNKNQTTLVCYPGGKAGSYTIPSSVTVIEDYAFFDHTKLTAVIIPNSVTTVGAQAFYYCTGLASVTIGNAVTTIRSNAFRMCTGLREIINLSLSPVSINANVFQNVTKSNCTLKVATSAVTSYQGTPVWQDFPIVGSGIVVSAKANNSEAGSISGLDNVFYTSGTGITLTATANQDYAFENWTSNGTVISTDNPFSFTVTQDTSIIANFAPVFTVSASVNNALYGSATGEGDYPSNTTATLTATANQGYVFENWTSNGTIISTDNPFIFTVTQDTSIVANFALDVFTVSTSVNNTLYGSVTEGGDYTYNTDATLTATANQGYVFENWTSNGTVISTENPFTFTVTQDTAIVANFREVLGIIETNSPSNSVSIYPNPAKDVLFISSENGINRVEIADLAGRTVGTNNYLSAQQGAAAINVSHLPKGVYLVKIYTDKGVAVEKTVKE